MKKKRSGISLIICILILCLAPVLTGCSHEGGIRAGSEMTSYRDLNDADVRIGVMAGGISGEVTDEMIPEAQRFIYNTLVDLIAALETGKVDAIVDDNGTLLYYNRETGGTMRLLEDYLKPCEYAFVFAQNDDGRFLCAELSEFINKIRTDGTLAEINRNWLDEDGAHELSVDDTALPAPNGVLRFATTAVAPPFCYTENDRFTGYDMDILSRFCEEYGYGIEVVPMAFGGLIPAVSTGNCDIGGDAISITEERKESVIFSNPYYEGGIAAAVYDPESTDGDSLIGQLKNSFYKTFIREERYRMFLSGILTTLNIALGAAFFGTIIGFLIYMCCHTGNRLANKLTRIYTSIIQGLPNVVILMILYYLVFSGSGASGSFVSVIAFTLTFASSVYGILRAGIGAIDRGQTEAAYALGFGNQSTFFSIVLPQAMVHILPRFKSELVSLVKATSIVGYIAVADLTRMGDIIRSRTFDAFFPLVAAAVFYFIMARILIDMLNKLERRIDPKHRKKKDILKGVEKHD